MIFSMNFKKMYYNLQALIKPFEFYPRFELLLVLDPRQRQMSFKKNTDHSVDHDIPSSTASMLFLMLASQVSSH